MLCGSAVSRLPFGLWVDLWITPGMTPRPLPPRVRGKGGWVSTLPKSCNAARALQVGCKMREGSEDEFYRRRLGLEVAEGKLSNVGFWSARARLV